jgi:transcriptional regulator with XRE-family HTH domain
MLTVNLKTLRKLNGESQQDIANLLGIPRTTYSDYEQGNSEPNIQKLIRLSEHFKVSIGDIVGVKINPEKVELLKTNDFKVLAITVDPQNNNNIELVSTKAAAGYLDSFADPEYLADLPKLSFPNIPQGTYRGFEIKGDSMLPMLPGSIVISSYVESLDNIKDNKTYIVISKNEGVVYKRLINNASKNKLTLISDNTSYSPYDLNYEEVAEVWQYFAHLSFTDAKSSMDYVVDDRLTDMHNKINAMMSKINS